MNNGRQVIKIHNTALPNQAQIGREELVLCPSYWRQDERR